jgi:hypothetical protein
MCPGLANEHPLPVFIPYALGKPPEARPARLLAFEKPSLVRRTVVGSRCRTGVRSYQGDQNAEA